MYLNYKNTQLKSKTKTKYSSRIFFKTKLSRKTILK
jgi:hypothetical protein